MLKRYEYHFDGKALGATVIILARDIPQANKLAQAWCCNNGLVPPKEILPIEVIPFSCIPGVVYGWDGDY